MKKLLSMTLLLSAMFIMFTACSSDDDDAKFDYPLETLYGTWKGTGIYVNGSGWINITSPHSKYNFSIQFNSNGTYYGKGYFGTGSGTYKAVGDKIYTYVAGKEYNYYQVASLEGNKAMLAMGVTGASEFIMIKVEKE